MSAATERSNATASGQSYPPGIGSTRILFRTLRRTGDPRAREALVTRFLPLARTLARRYYSGGEPLDDLVQVASVGLVKAVERFDETRGVSFSSFAVPTINGELRRYFRDRVWSLHVPRGMQERALDVKRAHRELTDQTGRAPTVLQIAERLGIDESGVLDGLRTYEAFDALSLDEPTGGDDAEPRARIDTIGSTDPGFELAEDRLTVGALVRRLPLRERRVLHMRYVENRTQSDIATRIGVSQMQVSRILKGTLGRLQRSVEHSPALATMSPS